MSIQTLCRRSCAILCGQIAALLAFAQNPEVPLADVHAAAKSTSQFQQYVRTNPPRGGRYELRNASMLDLVRIAYAFDQDKVLDGPSWLEMSRYDVVVKVPADATPEVGNAALQSLLSGRFKLVTHKDTKPLPTWALTVGRKPLMKEAAKDEEGATGCRPHSDENSPPPPPPPGAPGAGISRIMTMGPDGKVTTFTLGPGQIVQYTCHNVTMETFAVAMRSMIGASLGPNPVLDETNLKGTWNFDLKYSLNFVGLGTGNDDRISFPDAVEKQLGLKLQQHPNPTPVLIVDSVEEKPTPNPPGVAEALPAPKIPTEFEVADIKITDPGATFGRIQNQPGGRFISTGMPLSAVINNAFLNTTNDQIIGMPAFANSVRYDITAKANVDPGTNLDPETTAPLLLALLKDRFGLKYHTEERPLPAWSLVAVKPKMKKADPTSRTHCARANGPTGSPPGTLMITCQNITMAQFTEQLRGIGRDLQIQPLDATGIEGGWDFVLTFNQRAGMNVGPARNADAADAPAASDPTGGYTVFEAIEKELGLKLEQQKRPLPVYVIDHLDQKPTDN